MARFTRGIAAAIALIGCSFFIVHRHGARRKVLKKHRTSGAVRVKAAGPQSVPCDAAEAASPAVFISPLEKAEAGTYGGGTPEKAETPQAPPVFAVAGPMCFAYDFSDLPGGRVIPPNSNIAFSSVEGNFEYDANTAEFTVSSDGVYMVNYAVHYTVGAGAAINLFVNSCGLPGGIRLNASSGEAGATLLCNLYKYERLALKNQSNICITKNASPYIGARLMAVKVADRA